MAYVVKKSHTLSNGTTTWRIASVVEGANGKRVTKYIPKIEWQNTLGIDPRTTTKEQAQDICRRLNKIEDVRRREEIKNKVNERLNEEEEIDCIHLPKSFVREFEEVVLVERLGHSDKVMSHWRAVKRLIRTVQLDPSDWADRSFKIYNYFEDRKDSPSYAQKLLRILNIWGQWISKKQSKAFLPVEFPRGNKRERIASSYFDKNEKGMASAPIAPSDLDMAKSKLKTEHYNWLYISIWFGLRPSEIDQLLKPDSYKIEMEGSVKVLYVYQTKLSSIPRADRWKLIPILQPQQDYALSLIASGNFKRPLTKTIKLHVKDGATCYAGRKAFHKLMSDYGYGIELISAWMGHKSVERTWRSYRDNLKVALPPKKDVA